MQKLKSFSAYSRPIQINNLTVFSKVLLEYLRNILSIDQNFKVFSNKIIEKYSQMIQVKRYTIINSTFLMLQNKITKTYSSAFLKIFNYKKKPRSTSRSQNRPKTPSYKLENSLENPMKNYSFNNCSFVNYANSTSMTPKSNKKMTPKSIFEKRQNTNIITKLKKEHNIKFKKPLFYFSNNYLKETEKSDAGSKDSMILDEMNDTKGNINQYTSEVPAETVEEIEYNYYDDDISNPNSEQISFYKPKEILSLRSSLDSSYQN